MVGAAASTQDVEMGKLIAQSAVKRTEFRGVAHVEFGRLIQFRMTLARGIGTQAADAAHPRRIGAQLTGKMGGDAHS